MIEKKFGGRWLVIALAFMIIVSAYYLSNSRNVSQKAVLSIGHGEPIASQTQEIALHTVVPERGNDVKEAVHINSKRIITRTHIRHAGRRLVLVSEDDNGYKFANINGDIVMFFDRREVSRDLDKPWSISKEEALEKAKSFCGGTYTLKRITENPHDFDILMQRFIESVEVFTDDCYVGINRHTGEMGVYRKLPLSDVSDISSLRLTKNQALLAAGVDVFNVTRVRLIYIPSHGLYWIIQPDNGIHSIVISDEIGLTVELASMHQVIKGFTRRIYE